MKNRKRSSGHTHPEIKKWEEQHTKRISYFICAGIIYKLQNKDYLVLLLLFFFFCCCCSTWSYLLFMVVNRACARACLFDFGRQTLGAVLLAGLGIILFFSSLIFSISSLIWKRKWTRKKKLYTLVGYKYEARYISFYDCLSSIVLHVPHLCVFLSASNWAASFPASRSKWKELKEKESSSWD